MKPVFLAFFAFLICSHVFAQVDTTRTDTTRSVYGNLKTEKIYRVNTSFSSANGITVYIADGREVDKKTYGKYQGSLEVFQTCQPCIQMEYDINETLISKAVYYTDCPVGYWIDYFPNGKAKRIGHFKENESLNWIGLAERGFCVPDGTFTHFNEQGEELYSEYWKDGQFLKQVPEQGKTELWAIDFTLNDMDINGQTLAPAQFNEIKITPRYKNSLNSGANITIGVEITSVDGKRSSETFNQEDFSNIIIDKMLAEGRLTSGGPLSCMITVYQGGEIFTSFWLTIKP